MAENKKVMEEEAVDTKETKAEQTCEETKDTKETAAEEAKETAAEEKDTKKEEKSEKKANDLETEIKSIRLSAATTLVDKAIQLGLIPEALKDSQLKSFEGDFDAQKVILTKLIADKETANGQGGDQTKLKEVILAGKTTTTIGDTEESFDYLQKHNTVKLAKIRDEQPEQYAKLAKDYAAGVRHTNK